MARDDEFYWADLQDPAPPAHFRTTRLYIVYFAQPWLFDVHTYLEAHTAEQPTYHHPADNSYDFSMRSHAP